MRRLGARASDCHAQQGSEGEDGGPAAAIECAARLGLHAVYDREHDGVWIGGQKLAAIGVQVSRRVAIHGMALNVTTEATRPFGQRWFVPCGQVEGRAVSLQEACAALDSSAAPPTIDAVLGPLTDALLRRADCPVRSPQITNVSLLSQILSVI